MNIEEIGHKIRRRRKDLGVDQQSLAEFAEVSVHTLSDIESGKGNPTLETLEAVLDVLGLELAVQTKKGPGRAGKSQ